jgi:hypothetical protein
MNSKPGSFADQHSFNSITYFSVSTETTDKTSVEAKKGHCFKMTRIHKSDAVCTLCSRSLSSLLVQGLRCSGWCFHSQIIQCFSACKLSFHKECSTFATNIPCIPPTSPSRSDTPRRPWDIRGNKTSPQISLARTFNLTKTKQQVSRRNGEKRSKLFRPIPLLF